MVLRRRNAESIKSLSELLNELRTNDDFRKENLMTLI
jgi:hypothetical protein